MAITIGQGEIFNNFVYYLKPDGMGGYAPITGAPALPSGWQVFKVNDFTTGAAATGEFSVTLINPNTNQFYVAGRGTNNIFPDVGNRVRRRQ